MIEFYLPIKHLHIAAVLISGGLFFLRGMLLLNGRTWAMSAPMRYLSYSIDTVLLVAALLLIAILPSAVFANGWLTLKLLLLLVYVVLGSFALKRGRSYTIRCWCFASAIFIYLFMISIARMHQPLGIFYE